MKTFYQVLQVSPDASQEVIEAAWKTLMTVHHPDRGGNPEKAREINNAHDVLKDPAKRKLYDAQIRPQVVHESVRSDFPHAYGGAYPPPYPEAYPTHPLNPFGFAEDVFFEELKTDLEGAIERASLSMFEKMADRNPILRTFYLKLKQERQAKAKKRPA